MKLHHAIKSIAAAAVFYWAAATFPLNTHAALPITQWSLPSGAQVFWVPSPGIAMLDVQIDFDAGSRRDPAAQAGLASLAASLLSKGVAARGDAPALDENQLGEAWADLGAEFTSSAGSDRMSFTLRTLTDADLLGKAVQLAARQIGEPAFPDAVWQQDRQKLAASLKEANNRPATVASRAYNRAVYSGHPYGFELTEDTLGRINTADMRAFYGRHVSACRAKISLVGAVTREQADAIATQLLARLPQTPCADLPALGAVAEVPPLAAPDEQLLPFDAAQAHVRIGQPGHKRDDPAFFPLLVGNYILGGGGFVSRLTTEVREKRGLTYGVQSAFAPGLHAGAFTISLQTRPDQAAQALGVARGVLTDFVAQGPTGPEVQAAKDNLIGGFALLIDSNRKLLGNVASIAWNGLPLTYLDTWQAKVAAVSAQDIQAAFARTLQPKRMATVVVGGKP